MSSQAQHHSKRRFSPLWFPMAMCMCVWVSTTCLFAIYVYLRARPPTVRTGAVCGIKSARGGSTCCAAAQFSFWWGRRNAVAFAAITDYYRSLFSFSNYPGLISSVLSISLTVFLLDCFWRTVRPHLPLPWLHIWQTTECVSRISDFVSLYPSFLPDIPTQLQKELLIRHWPGSTKNRKPDSIMRLLCLPKQPPHPSNLPPIVSVSNLLKIVWFVVGMQNGMGPNGMGPMTNRLPPLQTVHPPAPNEKEWVLTAGNESLVDNVLAISLQYGGRLVSMGYYLRGQDVNYYAIMHKYSGKTRSFKLGNWFMFSGPVFIKPAPMTFDELIKAVRENEARDLALTQVCGQEGKPGEITFTTYWERIPGVEFHVRVTRFIPFL